MNEITLGGVKWYMIGENKEFLRTNSFENRISGSISNTVAQKDNVPSNTSTSNEKEKSNNNKERSNRAKRTKDSGQSVSRERERSQEFRDRKWNVKTK